MDLNSNHNISPQHRHQLQLNQMKFWAETVTNNFIFIVFNSHCCVNIVTISQNSSYQHVNGINGHAMNMHVTKTPQQPAPIQVAGDHPTVKTVLKGRIRRAWLQLVRCAPYLIHPENRGFSPADVGDRTDRCKDGKTGSPRGQKDRKSEKVEAREVDYPKVEVEYSPRNQSQDTEVGQGSGPGPMEMDPGPRRQE
ncbi:hypothetical protein DEU56DRAFT_760484 [Suillus clintonianus]|uniref:uncharacterized protein n=1 Tax=Suillus clintonianus TaxID=1904413 RepID=UPI001B88527C|nr:uncharacterized protein DEU56DRAFT_760484 [Suillus clintonianus]KAG2121964.1 hypothetical protein DEU56DRAFT_760484 [Suillus clintonianus]